ncbi:hypothetical protein LCM18_02980 [Qipengyuania flava]|nr:hypothetical protein LCM18_02980 [Qipengyuania flava]
MKKNDYKTQADVDETATRLLHEASGDLDLVYGNAVATALGMPKGNQSIYEKLDDWKTRMEAQGIRYVRQAPAGLREELEKRLRANEEDIVQVALGLTGKTIDGERQRSDQTETALCKRIAILESKVDRESEARMLADGKVDTMAKDMAELGRRMTAEKERADLAEARLDEVRCQHGALLAKLGGTSVQTEEVKETTSSEDDDDWSIDMSRYDYEG